MVVAGRSPVPPPWHEEHIPDLKEPNRDEPLAQEEQEHEPDLEVVEADVMDVARRPDLNRQHVAVLVVCVVLAIRVLPVVGPARARQ